MTAPMPAPLAWCGVGRPALASRWLLPGSSLICRQDQGNRSQEGKDQAL